MTRDRSIDALRGLVMVLMTLDHAREFLAGFSRPLDLETTTAALFLTRWVTHLCAPVFVFLAGTSAFLYGLRRTPAARSRFLWTRGLWLVALELTVVKLGWAPEPFYYVVLLQVIWAIGWSLLALSVLCRLPVAAVGVVGLVLVAVGGDPGGWVGPGPVRAFLFEPATFEPLPGRHVIFSYPVLAWIGIAALGYAFGVHARRPPAERRRTTLLLGLVLFALFVGLRAARLGDPVPWTALDRQGWTALSFLNCEKYPPSPAFALMTLGPALVLLSIFEGGTGAGRAGPLVLFGRVPLFYYVAHLYLLRLAGGVASYLQFGAAAFEPPPGPALTARLGLPAAYLATAGAVALLYPACRWFAGVKAGRRFWWLAYL